MVNTANSKPLALQQERDVQPAQCITPEEPMFFDIVISMNKKDYIYCTVIVFILIGSYLSIGQVIADQDDNCWDMIKEMSESKEI